MGSYTCALFSTVHVFWRHHHPSSPSKHHKMNNKKNKKQQRVPSQLCCTWWTVPYTWVVPYNEYWLALCKMAAQSSRLHIQNEGGHGFLIPWIRDVVVPFHHHRIQRRWNPMFPVNPRTLALNKSTWMKKKARCGKCLTRLRIRTTLWMTSCPSVCTVCGKTTCWRFRKWKIWLRLQGRLTLISKF